MLLRPMGAAVVVPMERQTIENTCEELIAPRKHFAHVILTNVRMSPHMQILQKHLGNYACRWGARSRG